MTPTEALHIIRHPEDYCAASRQEARTIIADGYEAAQERLNMLIEGITWVLDYQKRKANLVIKMKASKGDVSAQAFECVCYTLSNALAATEPKE